MKHAITVLLSLFLISCGGGSSDSGGGGGVHKNLFSFWVEVNTKESLDLRGVSFNTPTPFAIFGSDGTVCECQLTLKGSQTEGDFDLRNCRTFTGPSFCIGSAGTYTNLSGTFRIFLPDGRKEIYN